MPPLHDPRKECTCPKCGGVLMVRQAVTGMHPGHLYIHCVPCKYHYTFPMGLSQGIIALSAPPAPPAPPALPALIPAPPPAPIPAPLASSSNSGISGLCTNPGGCSHQRHRACGRQMCKRCCIDHNGCHLRDHSFDRLSEKQREKFYTRRSATQAAPVPRRHVESPSSPLSNNHPMSLPPLDPIALDMLQGLIADDPTIQLMERDALSEVERRREEEHEAREAMQEEIDYQKGLAASLGLPYTAPHVSEVAGPSTMPAGRSGASMPSKTVTTVPYKPKPITAHMNSTWMRPIVDNTGKPRRQARINLDNRFSVVFWAKGGEPPIIHAVHECPQWPKWVLMDDLHITEELGVTSKLLEFYDIPHRQWVRCTPSYPHDVKKDGRLFLRHSGVQCHGFEEQLKLATARPMHFRDNQAGERAAVRDQLRRHKREPPLVLINLSDNDDDDTPPPGSRKRPLTVEGDDLYPPAQRLRRHSPVPMSLSPPSSPSSAPTSRSFSRSPSIVVSSPRPLPVEVQSPSATPPRPSLPFLDKEILVPPSMKVWPDGMYTVDMARGILAVDSPACKTRYRVIQDRIAAVFGKAIPKNTFYDQRKLWNMATEHQRSSFKAAGRTPTGLWSAFVKATRGV